MNHVGGNGFWFGAAELAELKLPGLPGTKRKINELAAANRWALRSDAAGRPLVRKRAGKGGGLEYHVALLPQAASTALVLRGVTPAPKTFSAPAAPESIDDDRARRWAWFNAQPDKTKAVAKHRLGVLEAVEQLVNRTGSTLTAAIALVSASHQVCPATIHTWRGFVAGARPDDWLPRLIPNRVGGGAEAEIDPGAWKWFLSLYLAPEKRSWTNCYDAMLRDYATPNGVSVPHIKTFRRRVERDIDPRVVIMKREGEEALRKSLPSQRRSVAGLSALQLVNVDGHLWDVFVRWPDGTIARPMMVAIQDVYSRKILAWRIGPSESAVLTRLAFADLFQKWGIPQGCLLDNGRAFASKWITGGAKTRFRFKIREDEPTGLLPALSINVHWALPYRGSSKPIERAFKILCENGAKDIVFEGAYTGNTPLAKPENYGNSAVPLEVFTARVGQLIGFQNAKTGRRSEIARGKASYDQVFLESYQTAQIRKATPDQLKLALLTADMVTADRKTGLIRFMGNEYMADDLFAVRGQKVTIRFDPDNLHGDIHVYAPDGSFVCTAALRAAIGFQDVSSAKTRAREEADLRRRTRELYKAMDLHDAKVMAEQIAREIDAIEDDEDEPVQPTVIRPVRAAGRAVAAQPKPASPQMLDQFFDVYAPAEPAPDRSHLRIVRE